MFPRLLPPVSLYRPKKLPILYPHQGSLQKIQPIRSTAVNIAPIPLSQTALSQPALTQTALSPAQSLQRQDPMMAKAQEMEAAFLAEMLGHTGLDRMEGPFGGGEGEGQFASFLRQEQARLMVEKGGIGLAEMIFNSMAKASGDHA